MIGPSFTNPSETTPGLWRLETKDSFTIETVRPQAVENLYPKTTWTPEKTLVLGNLCSPFLWCFMPRKSLQGFLFCEFVEIYEVTPRISNKISPPTIDLLAHTASTVAKFQAQSANFPPNLQGHKGEEFDHFPVQICSHSRCGVFVCLKIIRYNFQRGGQAFCDIRQKHVEMMNLGKGTT